MNDFKLLRATLENIVVPRPDATTDAPQGLCLDKGYDYAEAREVVDELGFTPHIRSRGEEKKELESDAGFRARRWVIERTHAWLNRFRGLLIRWSKTQTTTAPCSSSPAASSPGDSPNQPPYRDRF